MRGDDDFKDKVQALDEPNGKLYNLVLVVLQGMQEKYGSYELSLEEYIYMSGMMLQYTRTEREKAARVLLKIANRPDPCQRQQQSDPDQQA